MGFRHSFHNNILDNPIAWREHLMLFRQRGRWMWRVIYALTVLLIAAPLLWSMSRHFRDSVEIVFTLLIFANIVMYPLVVVRSIITSNESIARERRGKTWDLLMLTGVPTWRVVFGKWIGSMRFLVRDYLWLYGLRVGTFFWAAVNGFLYKDYYAQYTFFDVRFDLSHLGYVLGIVFIFTVLELLFSTALGISTSFFNWRSRTSSGLAIGIRAGLALFILFVTLYVSTEFSFDDALDRHPPHLEDFIITIALSFADNGMTSSGRLLSDTSLAAESVDAIELALMITGAAYVVLTGVALEVARTAAHFVGVNHPVQINKPKRKRSDDVERTSALSERSIVAPVGASNIFELHDPDHYRTEVYHYQRRLGRMYLRITGDEYPIYAQISNVVYLEAPLVWQGANFRVAQQHEYEALIHEKELSISKLTANSMRLYLLDGDTPIKIIGGNIKIMEDLPNNI